MATFVKSDTIVKIKNTAITLRKVPGSKNWRIEIWVSEEKKYLMVTSGTDDIEIAEEKARELSYEIRIKIREGQSVFPQNFETVSTKWYEWIKEQNKSKLISDHMLAVYDGSYRLHILPYFKGYRVDAIDKEAMNGFVRNRIAGKPSGSAISRDKTTIKVIFTWLMEKGLYKRPVLPEFIIPTNYVIDAQATYFLSEEIPILLANLSEWVSKALHGDDREEEYKREVLNIFVKFMLEFGSRTNDRHYLRWRDIKCELTKEGRRKHKEGIETKGSKDYICQAFLSGKRTARKRGSWCSAPGAIWWELDYFRYQISEYDKEEDLVFCFEKDKPAKMDKMFAKFLEHYKMRLDTQGNARTLYSLRHTYITKKMNEGVAIDKIAKQCRTSVQQIEKTYGHQTVEDRHTILYEQGGSALLTAVDEEDDDD